MAYITTVVPVYKNEKSLKELYTRLAKALEGISADFQIIMVEDCGGDASWKIIKELSALDKRVKGFQFSRNFGQHYGITAGLDLCDSDWVVVMDADLQDRPEEIENLYRKAKSGFDVVLGKRINRKHNIFRQMASRLFYRVLGYFTGIAYDCRIGNFRIISRKVVDTSRQMRENLRFFGGMVDWMGFPTACIDIEHDERFHGRTSYTLKSLISLAANAIIAYSNKPLWLSINIGFLMSLLSFCAGIYIILRAMIWGIPITGWASIIVSLYFLSGIIIAILGVIGIYLGRTFNETKKRPLYIIKESTENAR